MTLPGPLQRWSESVALLITTGFLPQRFRGEMRLPWDPVRQRRFDRLMAVLRSVNHPVPRLVRRFRFNVLLWDLDRRIGTGRPLVQPARRSDPRANVAHGSEPGEIPVEGHHVTVVLDSDGRDHGVGDQVTRQVGLVAEFAQQHEVSRAGARREVVGLGVGGVDECERPRSR